VQDLTLGDLKPQAARIDPGLLDDPDDFLYEVGFRKILRCQIHAYGNGRFAQILVLPNPKLFADLVEDPLADRNNDLRLLRRRQKFARREKASFGVLPPQKGFKSVDSAGFKRDDGLIEHPQFLSLQGSPHFYLDLLEPDRALAHGSVKDYIARAALGLRLIQ